MDTLQHIIIGCLDKNREAQKALYDQYKAVLFGLCRRYIPVYEEAEDVFTEGMVKIFSKIQDFNNEGSFEGWMKRIMINESLMHLRKKDTLRYHAELDVVHQSEHTNIEEKIDNKSIKAAIEELPDGYRTVLNLYIIEGYKHREIAELLGISINTSKSQLILARKKLQEILKNKLDINAA